MMNVLTNTKNKQPAIEGDEIGEILADRTKPIKLENNSAFTDENGYYQAQQKDISSYTTIPVTENNTECISKIDPGWSNLIALVAFLGTVRYILVSFLELGWLVRCPFSGYSMKDFLWVAIVFSLNLLRLVTCFLTSHFLYASIACVLFSEAIISLLIFKGINDIYLSAMSHIFSIIYGMKLISFITNRTSPGVIKFLEFLIFPTLVYKDVYNRKGSINLATLRNTCGKLILCLLAMTFFMHQHALPAFYKLMLPDNLNNFLESFLNLSLASIILFNLMFKVVFDYGIIILSEITLFDESVCRKWWNSRSTEEFWKSWNLPVHLFVKKHIYVPLLQLGIKKRTSSFICFIFSGLMHEYIVSMSLKSFNGWFLIAMVAQIPLHFATNFVKRRFPSFANMFFWLSFCAIGQPLMGFLIYRTFSIKHTAGMYRI